MDGFDVLRLIRALKPKVPVAIMMSVWSEQEARLAFSFGAQDCVPKSKSIAKIKNGLPASLI
jgi:CheY-like chemotaxis protein